MKTIMTVIVPHSCFYGKHTHTKENMSVERVAVKCDSCKGTFYTEVKKGEPIPTVCEWCQKSGLEQGLAMFFIMLPIVIIAYFAIKAR